MKDYCRTEATNRAIDQWSMHQRASLLDVLAKCESPYEEQLVAALLCAWDGEALIFSLPPRRVILDGGAVATTGETGADVYLQRVELGYRLDVAIISDTVDEHGPVRVAVEVDGHAYHERTKAQAAHDRKRDRALQEAGWTVYRFTASEVHRDTVGCVEQIMRAVGIATRVYVPVPPQIVAAAQAMATARASAVDAVQRAETWEEQLDAMREASERARARLAIGGRR